MARADDGASEGHGVKNLHAAIGARSAEAIASAKSSHVRHGLRNRLGSIRNAAFFLRRRARPEWLEAEPRLAEFLDLIQSEATASEALLAETVSATSHGERTEFDRAVAAGVCAAEHAWESAEPIAPGPVVGVCFLDAASAVKLVLDAAAASLERRTFAVQAGTAELLVQWPGEASDPRIDAAHRLVRECGGRVEIDREAGMVRLSLPVVA
jgi:hypothetical protein